MPYLADSITTMKKTLLLTALAFGALALHAQKAMTFALPFSSGMMTYVLDKNPWGAEQVSPDEIVNGRYYRYVHFTSLPDRSERAALQLAGVNILYFEHGTTYVASIAQGTAFPLTGHDQLAGLSPIGATTKMLSELHVAVRGQVFPGFATDAYGNIGVTFAYYDDIPHNLVIDELAARKIFLTYANANSHRVTVWLQPAAIEAFCALPFVSAAELVDDVPQPDNLPGVTDHRSNMLAQDFSWGHQYNGTGIHVMLQDDGIIGPHIDYTGRIAGQYLLNNSGDHGDHCAGIIMGAGNRNPFTRGMGWGATLYVYSAVPYVGWDSIYTQYYSEDIVITSTSYSDGCNAGYTTLARELDQQIWDMPQLIHVFSAGNNGGVDCNYGAGTAFGNVTGGHKHSKNSIAVGNLDFIDNLNSSSSVGPVHDGRMKPEVCAVGTSVYSTVNDHTYAYKTGTSMSCPAVSGTFSQLYQAYRDIYGSTPYSGMMKCVMMNTCDDLLNPGPDFKTGYGRINGRRALDVIESNQMLMDSVDNAQSNTHTITVPSGVAQVRVMIYWHDFPAAANANVALVNNLDMTMTTPQAAIVQPWVLDYTPTVAALNANAVPGTDIRNNHEQITLNVPAAGTYTVTIAGTSVPMGPQPYFITWYFEPVNELVLTYPNGGEGLAPGETHTIRWDLQDQTADVDLEYTVDAGVTWLPIASNVNGSNLYYNWSVPVQLSGLCRVRIFTATYADTSDAEFSIAPVPSNFHVAWACPDSLCLKWNPVAGATSYDLFQLGAVYMDSFASTTLDSFVVTGLNNYTNTYWYSIRTRAPQNTVGHRAVAIEKAPGIFCPGEFDASVTEITSPLTTYLGCMVTTGIPVTVELTNPGLTSISNIPVSYSYDNGTPVNETYTGTIAAGATVTYTFTNTLNIGPPGNHNLEVWTTYPNDIVITNDTLTQSLVHLSATTVVPPYSQNFESFTTCGTSSDCGSTNCTLSSGWYNVPNGTDDIDWRTSEGATPSQNTGPSTDYAPGTATGNYLYLEASQCENQKAEAISPCIDLTSFTAPTLLFGYHMYGSNMGTFSVDVYANGMWNNDVFIRNGSQSMNWLQASVSLSAYQGQVILLRFRGTTGTGGALGDMAFDAVRVENVTSTPDYPFVSSLTVYPNPAQGLFNFTLEGVNNEAVTARVFDISGRLILEQQHGIRTGMFSASIDLSAYANGTYFFELTVGEATHTTRLVKEF